MPLPMPTGDPVILTGAAHALLSRIVDGIRYARAGIKLTDLRPSGNQSLLSVFENPGTRSAGVPLFAAGSTPHPFTVLPMRFVLPVPDRADGAHTFSFAGSDVSAELVIDVVAEAIVRDQLRGLGTAGSSFGVPLRCRRLVVQTIRSRRRVPTQLPRNRRGASGQSASNLSHPTMRCPHGRSRTDTAQTVSGPAEDSHRQRAGTSDARRALTRLQGSGRAGQCSDGIVLGFASKRTSWTGFSGLPGRI